MLLRRASVSVAGRVDLEDFRQYIYQTICVVKDYVPSNVSCTQVFFHLVYMKRETGWCALSTHHTLRSYLSLRNGTDVMQVHRLTLDIQQRCAS